MKKLMITVAAVAATSVAAVHAQDFGSGAEPVAVQALPPPVGEGAAIEQFQQALAEEIAPATTASKAIDEYLDKQMEKENGWKIGYDEDRDSVVEKVFLEFDVKNPKVSTDFVKLRKEKMDELLLMGKAKIIETIMSKMSGARILEIPGNPIAKQLAEEQKEMNKSLAVARENLVRLDKDLADKLERRGSIDAGELVAVISSWFTSAEKENIAAKMDEQKKADYAEAKSLFEDAQRAYNELAEKAEAMKGIIKSRMKSELDSISEMPIYGCTVLQQAESISRGSDGKYKYQIAILYAWSGEMMVAAGEILKGEAVKFKPGKKSIRGWLKSKAEKGALSQWIGPRQFIDDKGNMWYLGIAAAPVMSDSDDNNTEREIAELEARAEVMFALYADVKSSKHLEKLSQTKVGLDGSKQYTTLQDYSKTQSEMFKDIQISGNMELFSDTVRHDPSGLDIQVVICGVNSGSVKTLKDIQARTTALGIEVNTYQEIERGRQQQMKRAFEASKDNAAARAVGAAKANAEISKEAAKASARRSPRQQTTVVNGREDVQRPAAIHGQLKMGTVIITDDDDE